MNTAETSIPGINRLQHVGLVVGMAGMLCLVYTYFRDPLHFMRSYLFAFVFWMGLPLGCTAIRLIHNLISGTWGFPLRRPLESATKTLPLMAILGIPILLRLPLLYQWADPNIVAHDEILQYRAPYMNVHFFIIRAAIYFAFWMLVTHTINRWSHEQDVTGDPGLTMRIKKLSAPSLLFFGFIVSAAAIDWVMSLDPHWTSTIFGLIFTVGELLAAMSLLTLSAIRLSNQESMQGLVTPKLLNDYGNLLLVFTMLWAYLSFSQFLIIWAGNMREEIPWYMSRAFGGWTKVAVLLIVFHFAVPFFLLLTRFVKRRGQMLGLLAAGLLLMTMVDTYWMVEPSFSKSGPSLQATDLLAMIAFGGLWFWRYASNLQAKSFLPLNDPRLKVLLQHQSQA
jgi:hypothetical protein